MNKVVILGGNKLAEYLTIELAKKNFKIYHLTRNYSIKSTIAKSIKIKNYEFNTLRKKLNSIKPQLVINLISFTGDNVFKSIKINTTLPINLLKWSIENNVYLVLLGTAAEYGITRKKTCLENDNLKPSSIYGFSKSLQSLTIKKYYDLFQNKILLFRIFNLSGDILNQNNIIGKVNNFIKKNKNKKKILKLGNLSSMRDYIDVKLAANIIVKLITKNKFGIFNLGSGKATLTRKMIYRLMSKYKNLSFKELNIKFHKNETLYICADLTKLKRAINEKN